MSLALNQNVNLSETLKALFVAFLILSVSPSGSAFAQPKAPAKFKPNLTKAKYELGDLRKQETAQESQIRDLRDHEIEQLRTVLGRRLPNNRRADLYFRLAEIFLEGYRATFLLEGRVHEDRIQKGKSGEAIDRTFSRTYLTRGIEASQSILNLGIGFSKMDRVYYFLAFNHAELDQDAQSLKYYRELTKRFPQSPFTPEAYRALGFDAFKANRLKEAQNYFELALKFDESSTQPDVLHKLAWTHYRMKQGAKAVELMKKAIAEAAKDEEKFLSIQEEALRDMAIFMTESGRVQEALEYFEKVAGDKNYYPKTLASLAREYESRLQVAKAVEVYEALLRARPESDTAFKVFVALIDLELRTKQYDKARGRIANWKSPEPDSLEEELKPFYKNLRALVRRTATALHDTQRKGGKKVAKNLQQAEAFYELYLNTFLKKQDENNESNEIKMYLAEVKVALNKPTEGANIYREVLASNDPRYSKEAGLLIVGSLQRAVGKGRKSQNTATTAELDFVKASEDLYAAAPKSGEALSALSQSAQLLAAYPSSKERASNICTTIVTDAPASSDAVTCARLQLQMAADGLPKPDAIEATQKKILELQGNLPLMEADKRSGAKLLALIRDIQSRSRVDAITQFEKSKDYALAAKAYEDFASTASTPEKGEKALKSALTNYLNAKDSTSAIRIIKIWNQRYPKSKQTDEIQRSLATSLFILGDFKNSATLFEQIGKKSKDTGSFETAALILEGLGDFPGAIEVRESAQALKKPTALGLLSLGVLFEQTKKEQAAVNTYEKCFREKSLASAECGTRLGDLYVHFKDDARAKEIFRKVATLNTKPLSPFVGYARYRLAEFLEKDARFPELKLPEANLKVALEKRLAFFDNLNKAYRETVSAGGPWAISALYRLAKWTVKFADEVDQIAAPEGAKGSQLKQFKDTLLSVSKPLRTQALSALKLAYQKAVEAQVFSHDIPEVVDILADNGVDEPVRAQGPAGSYRVFGIPMDGGSAGREQAIESVRAHLTKDARSVTAWIDYGNLLSGEGKLILSRIAYERALALNPKNAAALNNRAVSILNSKGADDWLSAEEASTLFLNAVSYESLFAPAKQNHAKLLNYYRLFKKSKPLWDQSLVKLKGTASPELSEAHDGLGISLQGLGRFEEAWVQFKAAEDAGADKDRFVRVYHDAVKFSETGGDGFGKCISRLEDLEREKLKGFEIQAADRLKKTCEAWQKGKS